MKRYLLPPLVLFGLSLLIGPAGFGWPLPVIFWQLRLPRALLGLLVGGGLGLAGAALQGALRNPLADPGLLGISGAATLGAVIVFYWGIVRIFPPALPLAGMAGAGLGAAALLGFAGRNPSGPSLILAGIGLSAATAALVAFALALAPNAYALAELTFWLLGSLADHTLLECALVAPPILLGVILLLRSGPGLDALTLGEETAASLGMAPARTLRRVALGTALAAGAAAASAGGIGFVGLVVPNLLRRPLGERPGTLLVPAMCTGAALVLAADILVRLSVMALPLHGEPPIGVLTALLGAPFLVVIARRLAR